MRRRRQGRAHFLACLAERGYTPDEVRRLPLAWVERVVNHPRDGRGLLLPPPTGGVELPPLETQRRLLIARGVPEHHLDRLARDLAARSQKPKRRGRKRR